MKVSECKFYDSKMRPLLLVYDNPDVLSVLKDVRIMFKHGDGMFSGIRCIPNHWMSYIICRSPTRYVNITDYRYYG